MKRIIVCISIISFCLKLSAQKENIFDPTHRHELGVSVPSILSLGEDGLFLSYRYHLKKGALRFRLSRESDTDSRLRNSENIYSSNGVWNVDAGIEKHNWLGSRWMILWGFGFGYHRSFSSETTIPESNPSQLLLKTEETTEDVLKPMGTFGLRYQVSSRISFGTEVNLSYSLYFGTIRNREAGNTEITRRNYRLSIMDLDIPTSVYLQFTL